MNEINHTDKQSFEEQKRNLQVLDEIRAEGYFLYPKNLLTDGTRFDFCAYDFQHDIYFFAKFRDIIKN